VPLGVIVIPTAPHGHFLAGIASYSVYDGSFPILCIYAPGAVGCDCFDKLYHCSYHPMGEFERKAIALIGSRSIAFLYIFTIEKS
jgi:hypothetical protein